MTCQNDTFTHKGMRENRNCHKVKCEEVTIHKASDIRHHLLGTRLNCTQLPKRYNLGKRSFGTNAICGYF
eukprot:scaffold592_cov272-Chaetoceros_neogracile.AAC.40